MCSLALYNTESDYAQDNTGITTIDFSSILGLHASFCLSLGNKPTGKCLPSDPLIGSKNIQTLDDVHIPFVSAAIIENWH